ncbi:MAG TPA: NAD(P)H-dependent oxidoreductase, partial [Flavisolibacter sp.]
DVVTLIMKIEIISGSPRGTSITHRVALHLEKALRVATEHDVSIIDLSEVEMPQLQTVFATVESAPEAYRDVTRRMLAADAFVLVTPEYNGSYSAALKNLLDHYPKQHHKVFSIVTASTGALGGVRAALQLQELVYALFGIGSPYMLVTPHVDKKFDVDGNLLDPSFQKSVDLFIREFLWLAERVIGENVYNS